MPVSFSIDTQRGVVFSRRWGALSDAELRAHSWALVRDPRFQPTFRQIADLRDVARFDVSVDGIAQVAALNPFASDARRAAVIATDVAFGILRMYQSTATAEPENIFISRSLGEALTWIGLDPSTPWPAEADWIIGKAPS
jgi:hypothetical protein